MANNRMQSSLTSLLSAFQLLWSHTTATGRDFVLPGSRVEWLESRSTRWCRLLAAAAEDTLFVSALASLTNPDRSWVYKRCFLFIHSFETLKAGKMDILQVWYSLQCCASTADRFPAPRPPSRSSIVSLEEAHCWILLRTIPFWRLPFFASISSPQTNKTPKSLEEWGHPRSFRQESGM